VSKLSLVWNISDTLNGLMAIPNLIGLLLLTPVVVAETNKYFKTDKDSKNLGKLKTSTASETIS